MKIAKIFFYALLINSLFLIVLYAGNFQGLFSSVMNFSMTINPALIPDQPPITTGVGAGRPSTPSEVIPRPKISLPAQTKPLEKPKDEKKPEEKIEKPLLPIETEEPKEHEIQPQEQPVLPPEQPSVPQIEPSQEQIQQQAPSSSGAASVVQPQQQPSSSEKPIQELENTLGVKKKNFIQSFLEKMGINIRGVELEGEKMIRGSAPSTSKEKAPILEQTKIILSGRNTLADVVLKIEIVLIGACFLLTILLLFKKKRRL